MTNAPEPTGDRLTHIETETATLKEGLLGLGRNVDRLSQAFESHTQFTHRAFSEIQNTLATRAHTTDWRLVAQWIGVTAAVLSVLFGSWTLAATRVSALEITAAKNAEIRDLRMGYVEERLDALTARELAHETGPAHPNLAADLSELRARLEHLTQPTP